MISKDKIKKWVDLYLQHIEEVTPEVHVQKEEGYKFRAVNTFQNNFNIESQDLAKNLEKSLEQNNLVAGAFYFPKAVLLLFAEKHENETREVLRILFDETVDIGKRIDEAEKGFYRILENWNKEREDGDKMDNTFMGLRFLSLLLGFRFPDSCNAVKPREWNMFCRYIDEEFKIPQHTESGERYKMLEPCIEALRVYIKEMPEIQSIKNQLTRGLDFEDKEFHWMAQDIIFVTAKMLAGERSKEKPQQESVSIPETFSGIGDEVATCTGSMEFPLEEYLEEFIVKNWGSIDFGESLKLFIDEEGTPAQQYPTSEGVIDLLAKDAGDNFVVVELKKGRSNQQVVGQILSYVGWVKKNLAENNQKVRGIIVAADGNQALLDAVSTVKDFISVKYYRVKFNFDDPKQE